MNNKSLTILVFEGETVIQEVFINTFEEDDFCDNLPMWEINAYTWISIDKKDFEEHSFSFETKELEQKFNSFFEEVSSNGN